MKVKYANPMIEQLKPGRAGTMELTDGRTANFGVIRIERETLVHFTGQGLRVMYKPDMTPEEREVAQPLLALLETPGGEEQLELLGHLARTPLSMIKGLW